MGKQLTNWESTETWQRLVSSMLATGFKPDLRATATYFGTTYDTLENRFRKLKKEAEVLKSEVDRGDRGEITTPSRTKPTPSTPRKAKTPKKDPLQAVANGRVTKKTPNKRATIKQEQTGSDASSTFDDATNGMPVNINATAMDFDEDIFNDGLGGGDFDFN